MPVAGITLVFRRSPAQETALQELLIAQRDPHSTLYHQWLTPESFADRFGVADEDVAATESWLAGQGFHIESVARSRNRITFSGTAAQVRTAFGAELHHYQVEGELHFAPSLDLKLPAELASVTAAVLHLSDFRPKPGWKATPKFTSVSTQAHYLGPKDILTMYNMNSFYDQNIEGANQSIAIVGQSYVSSMLPSSISNFHMIANGEMQTNVIVPGSGVEAISPGDEAESEIDVEYASGIAQNANIFLVFVGSNQNYSVFDSIAFAITDKIAPVISISYGTCEPLLSTTELDENNALYEQASAQGQTLIASSGDSGSIACAPYSSADGATLAEQQELAVNFPASSPYVTAVGGTQMASGTFGAGSNVYWAGTPNNQDNVSSLLSYVPEVAWNESSVANGLASGGGGSSSYFSRPAWQNNFPGMPTGTFRVLPDIALQASIEDPGFLVCSDDPTLIYAEGQTESCVNGLLGSNNKYTTAGGTSIAAPIFAGFVALLNQSEKATGQGNINPQLYSLAANPGTYTSAFHDVSSGTTACVAGATGCSATGQANYATAAGYDQATGLGSIDAQALTAAWPVNSTAAQLHATGMLIDPPTSLTTVGQELAPGQTASVGIIVSDFTFQPSSSIPTGSVSVSLDGNVVNPSLAFSSTDSYANSATANYNLLIPSTPGSHVLTATYPGDAAHVPAGATYAFTVENVLASGGVTLNAQNLTLSNNSTGSTQITATPSGGYNGRLFWSVAVSSTSSTSLTGCYSIAPLLVNNVSTTGLTLGVGTACSTALPNFRGKFRGISDRSTRSYHRQEGSRSNLTTVAYACLLLCGGLVSRRRKWRSRLLLLIFMLPIAGMHLTGCGGGGNNSSTTTATSSGGSPGGATTYQVTLTGTDSVNASITATTTFTLKVN
jgi:subtilase family serine protease